MINITIPSGRYSLEELRTILSKSLTTDRDVELFITAMQQTNQLIEVERNTLETATKRAIKRRTPLYVTIPPESTVENRENAISVFRWTYYTTSSGEKLPRIAIRAGINWIKKHGYPLSAVLYKIYKNGEWVNIPERPTLFAGKGRYPTTIEAWRAEIPRGIVRKYGITNETPVKLRLENITINYQTTLTLWGYTMGAMISFGETKGGSMNRDLQLLGEDFVSPVTITLQEDIKNAGDKIINTLEDWLEGYDKEYYSMLVKTDQDDRLGITVPHVGEMLEPLVGEEAEIARIQFLDNDRYANTTVAIAQTDTPYSRIPPLSAFKTIVDNMNYERKEARGETKLIQTVLINREGY